VHLKGCHDGILCLQHCVESYVHPTLRIKPEKWRFDVCMFPYHASRDCRVRWEHGSRIKCPGVRTYDRQQGSAFALEAYQFARCYFRSRRLLISSPCRFVRPCLCVQGYGRYHALAIPYLCQSVELDPQIVYGSLHSEHWLGYPLLTPSTVAPEPLFEHLCSSRGSSDGRVSVGVARATPAGVALEALKEYWTPSRAVSLFQLCPL